MANYHQQLGRGEIRLLTLLSGGSDDDIHCWLSIASLDSPPVYEAVSYVWGDAGITKIISVQGSPRHVTPNLELALRALRKPREPRVIWVDALCINQSDVDEKNMQVPLMGSVYNSATNVIAWLGPSTPEIDMYGQWVRDYLPEWEGSRSSWWLHGEAVATRERVMTELRAYQGLLQVLGLPYWTRMWTFQEYQLASGDPICLCGVGGGLVARGSELIRSKRCLVKLIRALSSPANQENYRLKDLGQERAITDELLKVFNLDKSDNRFVFDQARFEGAKRLEGPSSLTTLLVSTAERECLKPVDRIYGIYALVPAMQAIYPLDYHKSAEVVLREATAYMVNHERLLPYHIFGVRNDALDFTCVPSWVPDYRQPVHFTPQSIHPSINYVWLTSNGNDKRAIKHGTCSGELDGTPAAAYVDNTLTTLHLSARDLGTCRVALRFGNRSMEVLHQLGRLLLNKEMGSTPSLLLEHNYQQRRGSWISEDDSAFTAQMTQLCVAHEDDSVNFEIPDILQALDHAFELNKEQPKGGDVEAWGPAGGPSSMLRHAVAGLRGKTLFVTEDNLFGIGLRAVRNGDVLILAPEVPFPLLLRPLEREATGGPRGQHRLVGTSYVAGIMEPLSIDQRVLADVKQQDLKLFSIW